MSVVNTIKEAATKAFSEIFKLEINSSDITVNATKPEFEGDYTIVLFSLIKQLKRSPEVAGKELGEYLLQNNADLFSGYNVIKGFLNLIIADKCWTNFLQQNYQNASVGFKEKTGRKVMVEYSSPNANKPLHLGHLRNIFLGWGTAEILKANGNDVVKTCIVNDRGIHISKSMIAWKLFANGATPQSTGIKGDHFVGDYYVKFNNVQKNQIKTIGLIAYELYRKHKSEFWRDDLILYSKVLTTAKNIFEELYQKVVKREISSYSKYHRSIYTYKYLKLFKDKNENYELLNDISILNFDEKALTKAFAKRVTKEKLLVLASYFENETPILKQAQQMLVDWEAGKPDVIELWKMMNSWVYEGFDETYKRIGADFDRIYYESNTYLLGKDMVEYGLKKGVFYMKEDGSVWIDLTADGLDEKIVRRKDGTSVYITQDIGLVLNKYEEYKCNESIYVVGDEQNYHFKVLKLIAQKLQLPSAGAIYHLSYGMIELPTGKMKSREGTVVDADDIVDEMMQIAKQKTEELGKVKDFTQEELQELYNIIGLGALKFFLLRVDPKKRMVFNPEESIDFHGFTGPFVQYTHARIKSILRKLAPDNLQLAAKEPLLNLEKQVIMQLEQFPSIIDEAATEHDPSKVAIYIFNLAKTYNAFYTEHSVANAETEEKKILRLQLCSLTAQTIKTGMALLGIQVPERM
jgi:arginyl-tRNA synthetase